MVKPKYKVPSKNFSALAKQSDVMEIRSTKFDKRGVSEIYSLSVNDILPYEKQTRKKFNDQDMKNLSDSIKEVGIISPLLVIKSEDIGKFFVINGERRLRAAKSIGLSKVPCIIEENNEKTELIALIDNIQRADLHPIELAHAYESLLLNSAYKDKKDLAEKAGVPYTSLLETLKLNELPEEIKNYSLNNNLKGRALFRTLLKLDDIESMKSILGIGKEKPKHFRKKKIIEVCIYRGEIEIKIYANQLTEKQKEDFIEKIKKFTSTVGLSKT
jgi:ParB family chromosome partitioning protein